MRLDPDGTKLDLSAWGRIQALRDQVQVCGAQSAWHKRGSRWMGTDRGDTGGARLELALSSRTRVNEN